MRILALDLGKYKSVWHAFRPSRSGLQFSQSSIDLNQRCQFCSELQNCKPVPVFSLPFFPCRYNGGLERRF